MNDWVYKNDKQVFNTWVEWENHLRFEPTFFDKGLYEVGVAIKSPAVRLKLMLTVLFRSLWTVNKADGVVTQPRVG